MLECEYCKTHKFEESMNGLTALSYHIILVHAGEIKRKDPLELTNDWSGKSEITN